MSDFSEARHKGIKDAVIDPRALERNGGPSVILERLDSVGKLVMLTTILGMKLPGPGSTDILNTERRRGLPPGTRAMLGLCLVALIASSCVDAGNSNPIATQTVSTSPTVTAPYAGTPTQVSTREARTPRSTTPPDFVPAGHPDRATATAIAESPVTDAFKLIPQGDPQFSDLVEQHEVLTYLRNPGDHLMLAVHEHVIVVWSNDPDSAIFLPQPPGDAELSLLFGFIERSVSHFAEGDMPSKKPIIYLVNDTPLISLAYKRAQFFIPEFSIECGVPYIVLGYDPENPIVSAVAGNHELVHKLGKIPDPIVELLTRAYAELLFGYTYLTERDQQRFYGQNFNGLSPFGARYKGYPVGGLEIWLLQHGVSIREATHDVVRQDGYGDAWESGNPFAILNPLNLLGAGHAGCPDHSSYFVYLEEWFVQRTGNSFRSHMHEYHLRLMAGGEGMDERIPIPDMFVTNVPEFTGDEGTLTFPASGLTEEGLYSYSTSMFLLPDWVKEGEITIPAEFDVSVVPVYVGDNGLITGVVGEVENLQTRSEEGTLSFNCVHNGRRNMRYVMVLTFGSPQGAIMMGGMTMKVGGDDITLTLSR